MLHGCVELAALPFQRADVIQNAGAQVAVAAGLLSELQRLIEVRSCCVILPVLRFDHAAKVGCLCLRVQCLLQCFIHVALTVMHIAGGGAHQHGGARLLQFIGRKPIAKCSQRLIDLALHLKQAAAQILHMKRGGVRRRPRCLIQRGHRLIGNAGQLQPFGAQQCQRAAVFFMRQVGRRHITEDVERSRRMATQCLLFAMVEPHPHRHRRLAALDVVPCRQHRLAACFILPRGLQVQCHTRIGRRVCQHMIVHPCRQHQPASLVFANEVSVN